MVASGDAGMIRRAAILAAALLLLAGCGPAWQQRGETIGAPRLTEEAFVTADGAKLPLWSWEADTDAPKSVILAIHGFAQYGGAFRQPAEEITRESWNATLELNLTGVYCLS